MLCVPVAEPEEIVFDGTTFYALGSADGFESTMSVGRIPTNGDPITALVTMPVDWWGGEIAVDDTCLYWANGEGIFTIDKTATGEFDQ